MSQAAFANPAFADPAFADPAYQPKKKVTRREKFLQEMDRVVPWQSLIELIRPHYPTGRGGRPPMPLEKMLRVYFLQQWFNLSDPAMEEALYDSDSMRRFAGFRLGEEAIPDESTILKFRHLLEAHHLTEQFFDQVRVFLEEQGLILKRGTIVDATIISAPSSTENQRPGRNKQGEEIKGARDPEMSSTKKNNCWYFGMKVHVGSDSEYGFVHTIKTTAAKVHDGTMMEELLHGEEKAVYGDKAYVSQDREEKCRKRGVAWRVSHKAGKGKELSEHQKLSNQRRSRIRAQGEHAFGMVKNTWGHRKVRYFGLAKNTCQMFSLFMLSNLMMARYLLRDENDQPLLQPSG